jgi:hypothetical protein
MSLMSPLMVCLRRNVKCNADPQSYLVLRPSPPWVLSVLPSSNLDWELVSRTKIFRLSTPTGPRSDSCTSVSRPMSELPTLVSLTTRCREGELPNLIRAERC